MRRGHALAMLIGQVTTGTLGPGASGPWKSGAPMVTGEGLGRGDMRPQTLTAQHHSQSQDS